MDNTYSQRCQGNLFPPSETVIWIFVASEVFQVFWGKNKQKILISFCFCFAKVKIFIPLLSWII